MAKSGPGLEFDPDEVKLVREKQDQVLAQLYLDAGLPGAASSPPEWKRTIEAGMNYADRRCEDYLHALFRLNRARKTAVAQTGLMGAATAGVMAALESAAKEVAVVAIAFGLVSSTIENLSSAVLYELEPSSVRTMVKGLQAGYRENLPPAYDTRPAAIAVIRGYSALCVPANIEAEVNLAVKKATPETVPGDASKGRPPISTHASVVKSTVTFGADRTSKLLNDFLNPGGALDKNKLGELQKYLQDRGIQSTVSAFTFGSSHAEERKRAADFFGLK